MIFSFFSLFLFFVFTSSKEVEPISLDESQLPAERIELTIEQDKRLEGDCRYLDEPIPHRDLSGYEVISEQSSESNHELSVEQSENEKQTDSAQSETVEEKLELSPTDIEVQE